jgi:drug/metabolite transporter (DMT)-like permease
MLWLSLSIGGALLNSLRELLTRRVTVNSTVRLDALACALRNLLVIALMGVVATIWYCTGSQGAHYRAAFTGVLPLLLVASLLETGGQLLYFYAMSRIHVGTLSAIWSSTPLWVVPLNLIWYNDGAMTPMGMLGMALLFVSVVLPFAGGLMSAKKDSCPEAKYGMLATLGSAMLFAGTTLIMKKMMVEIGPATLAIWYPPVLLYLGVLTLIKKPARECLRRHGLFTAHTWMFPFHVVVMIFTVQAYALAPAAWVSSAKRAGVLFTVIAGAWLLGETSSFKRNFVAAIIAIAGLAALAFGQ